MVHSLYLCIIKQGGASPEYMSDTAPLLATVNMLDKNRRGFLKTKRCHNEKDLGIGADLNSSLKEIYCVQANNYSPVTLYYKIRLVSQFIVLLYDCDLIWRIYYIAKGFQIGKKSELSTTFLWFKCSISTI